MSIPFIDIQAAHNPIRREIDEAVKEVFDKANFVMGEPVKKFEAEFSAYCGAPHAIAVASGTDALIIALRALDIGPGDAVITTPFTFIATAEAVHVVGATPVFCDIDPGTYNLDANAVQQLIETKCKVVDGAVILPNGDKLKALLPVHIYGQSARMDLFMKLAKKYNLAVIEDAAQALGARCDIDGEMKQVCDIGDIGCTSFYPSKNLGGVGDGGMMTTLRDVLADRIKVLHLHGCKVKYHHIESGYNSRLDTLQAAVLSVKLKQLDGWLEARREHATRYLSAIREGAAKLGINVAEASQMRNAPIPAAPYIILPSEDKETPHTFNSFDIRVSGRDALAAHLQKQGIGCMVYYPIPLHLQEVYLHLGYKPGDMPVSEAVAADIVALPFYPGIPDEHIDKIVDTTLEFIASEK